MQDLIMISKTDISNQDKWCFGMVTVQARPIIFSLKLMGASRYKCLCLDYFIWPKSKTNQPQFMSNLCHGQIDKFEKLLS